MEGLYRGEYEGKATVRCRFGGQENMEEVSEEQGPLAIKDKMKKKN